MIVNMVIIEPIKAASFTLEIGNVIVFECLNMLELQLVEL